MIYNVANTSAIDKPIQLRDAWGEVITWAIEADTSTGRVVRYVTNEKDHPIEKNGELVTETRYYVAPLKVKYLSPE